MHFGGDRYAGVRDPFGHCWAIATRKWDLTKDEIEERQTGLGQVARVAGRAPNAPPGAGAALLVR